MCDILLLIGCCILAYEIASIDGAIFKHRKRIEPTIRDDAQLLAPQLITKYGYTGETHHVTTTDGYILEMHRIRPQNVSRTPRATPKPPALLVHGLLDSSGTWLLMGPRQGLGYLLADRGYDVWLGNVRGNRYSRRHRNLNPDGNRRERRRFWDFSWHEMGTLDVPQMIDHVLAETGFEQLHYIGHSQGTTSFFVMGAERPEYNAKILAMQALAPVAFMAHLKSPSTRVSVKFLNVMDITARFWGIYEILPHSEHYKFCSQSTAACDAALRVSVGLNTEQRNATMMPVIAGHFPAGTSTKAALHYGQLIRSGRFRRYDYGLRNWVKYGDWEVPEYDLRNVVAPVTLYYSNNDYFAAVEDVKRLAAALPNVTGMILVPDAMFTHLNFLWATDVERLVYARMFAQMRRAEEGSLGRIATKLK